MVKKGPGRETGALLVHTMKYRDKCLLPSPDELDVADHLLLL